MSAVVIISLIGNVVMLSFLGYRYFKRCPPKQWQDYTVLDPFWRDKVAFYDILNTLKNNDVFLVGDSMFDRLPMEDLWPDLSVGNRGIGYDNTRALLSRLNETVLKGAPRKVLLYIGGNDISKRSDLKAIVQEAGRIIEVLRKHKIEVCFVSLLPRGKKYSPSKRSLKAINNDIILFNQAVQEKCLNLGVQFADIIASFVEEGFYLNANYTSDEIHLNAQGTVLLAKLLEPYIRN